MLDASSANMIRTGMLMSAVMMRTPATSAPGNATSAKKIEYAIVDPIGAEMTALKIVASRAEAERTSPVLLRTKSLLAVAMAPSRRLTDPNLTHRSKAGRVEHNRTPVSSGFGHGGTPSGQVLNKPQDLTRRRRRATC